MKARLAAILLALLSISPLAAQTEETTTLEMIDFAEAEFVPHWQVGLQAGAAADLGEAPFSKLISPAVQATIEYRFHELFGIRGSVSGLWARNRYVFNKRDYQWNFIEPAVELKVDLASLLLGWVPDQTVSAYASAGVGAAFTFGNDDAKKSRNYYYKENKALSNNYEFAKYWKDFRTNLAFRGGLGVDYRINETVSLSGEVNANLMPDHFNSKQGKHDNKDWHFNALLGVKVNLGKTYRANEPTYQAVHTVAAPHEPIIRDTVALQVNIQFLINSSVLRSSEFGKLNQLLNYLRSHPRTHVEMTGYADRLTGTPTINERLSQERAAAVANWLISRGIEPARIYKDAKGDRVQPFPVNEDNRVTICYIVEILQ